MNNKLLIKSLILFSFLLIGSIGQGQVLGQDVSNVGVSVGDSFNYKITKNDFTQTSAYINELITFYGIENISSSYNFDFSSLIETLNATIVPGEGSVLGVTVAQIPGTDAVGALNYTYGSTTKTITTGFLLGTPVTFMDWSFWKDLLYALQDKYGTNSEPVITAGVYNDTSTFNATLSIQYNTVPADLASNGFTSLTVSMDAKYDATTGVVNSETFSITLGGQQVPVVNTFSFQKTTASLTSKSDTNTSSPGFEAIALLGALPVVAVFYRRRK